MKKNNCGKLCLPCYLVKSYLQMEKKKTHTQRWLLIWACFNTQWMLGLACVTLTLYKWRRWILCIFIDLDVVQLKAEAPVLILEYLRSGGTDCTLTVSSEEMGSSLLNRRPLSKPSCSPSSWTRWLCSPILPQHQLSPLPFTIIPCLASCLSSEHFGPGPQLVYCSISQALWTGWPQECSIDVCKIRK